MKKDSILMYTFLSKGATLEEIEALNQCMLFLKAFYLSDTSDVSGTCILEEAWQGKRSLPTIRQVCWPNQGAPARKA